jgi:Transcriptional regulator, contains sigma factor-related N-terminal domain
MIDPDHTDQNKIRQALKVSRLYYEDNLSQTEIQGKIGLSRPTISKLLRFAREIDLVQIRVRDPFQNVEILKQDLKLKYGLKDVLISLNSIGRSENMLRDLGQLTARYLDSIVKDGTIIGISWGKTLNAVSEELNESQCSNVKVVQLKGSISKSIQSNFSRDIVNRFNHAFHTQVEILPLPVIFDNPKTREIVIKDRFIKSILDEGIRANIALFTAGTVQPNAMLFQLGYLDNREINFLRENAVGDILSRFITKDGSIADPELNARTVGIQLEQLREKDYSVLIAGGNRKINSIHAVLLKKYANVLITDQNTANKLLDIE